MFTAPTSPEMIGLHLLIFLASAGLYLDFRLESRNVTLVKCEHVLRVTLETYTNANVIAHKP